MVWPSAFVPRAAAQKYPGPTYVVWSATSIPVSESDCSEWAHVRFISTMHNRGTGAPGGYSSNGPPSIRPGHLLPERQPSRSSPSVLSAAVCSRSTDFRWSRGAPSPPSARCRDTRVAICYHGQILRCAARTLVLVLLGVGRGFGLSCSGLDLHLSFCWLVHPLPCGIFFWYWWFL